MNKKMKAVVAVLGSSDALFRMFTPIALAFLWITTFNYPDKMSYVILTFAFFASFYRAIKIGFVKE